jgi:hypothetical protein
MLDSCQSRPVKYVFGGRIALVVDFPLTLLPLSVTPVLPEGYQRKLSLLLSQNLCIFGMDKDIVLHDGLTPQAQS